MEAPGHRAEASVACDAPVETRFRLKLRRMLTPAAISVLVKHLLTSEWQTDVHA